jgi:hypothetical protein
MASILESFLSYGLIENIDGSDERYEKIEQATATLTDYFREEPALLITAIVSGLNPKVPLLDKFIIKAKECLQKEWKAYATVYTDAPINLFRGMILEACDNISEDDFNASIMWLSASDVLPLLELGKEEQLLNEFMTSLAHQAESNCIKDNNLVKLQKEKVIKLDVIEEQAGFGTIKIDRSKLFTRMGDAAGNTHKSKEGTNVTGDNPNPHWGHNTGYQWCGEFADRMSDTVADVLENVATKLTKNDNALNTGLVKYKQQLKEGLEKALNEQRLNTQKHLKETLAAQTQEQTRLNVLWWSEALYSPSLNSSYREYSTEIASTLMPFDLLDEINVPVPASVGYMLSETVSKLKDVGFEKQLCFYEFLTSLRSEKGNIDSEWLDNLQLPESDTALNILDLIITALKAESCDLEALINNSVVPEKWQSSLPILSRIIFKQAQAYAIVRDNK